MLKVSHHVTLATENTTSESEDWPVELDLVLAMHVIAEPDPKKPNLTNIANKMGKPYTRGILNTRLFKLKSAAYSSAVKALAEVRTKIYDPPKTASQGSRTQQGTSQRASGSGRSNQPRNTQRNQKNANQGRNFRRNLPVQITNLPNLTFGDHGSTGNNGIAAYGRQNAVRDVERLNRQICDFVTPQNHSIPSAGLANATVKTFAQQCLPAVGGSNDGFRSNASIRTPSSSLSSAPSSSPSGSDLRICESSSRISSTGTMRTSTEETLQAEQRASNKRRGPCQAVEKNSYPDGDPGPSNSADGKKNKSKSQKSDSINGEDGDNDGDGRSDEKQKKRRRSNSNKGKPSKGGQTCKTCKFCQRNCVCDHVSVLPAGPNA